MATITIEISDEQAALLSQLAKLCTDADVDRDGGTTHGEMTVEKLLAMLAEDAALVIRRPGCWEAENMATVLSSHGYQL